MGPLVSRMGSPLGARETSDLNDEQVEEIRMVTSLPEGEIHSLRRKYRAITSHETMSKDEFYSLPGMTVNPLKDQVFKMFELTTDGTIPFIEFARFIAVYSYHSSQETKLREAFRLHDFDGDGRISREDLKIYLSLTYQGSTEEGESVEDATKRQQETMENVVSRVLEEAASDPNRELLVYEDFIKVVQPTDYESHLIFPF